MNKIRGWVRLNCALIYDAMGIFQFVLFSVMFAVGTPSMAQTQSSIEHPKVAIDVVELEGTLLPETVQEQLATSLKQREWEENSDWEADVRSMVVTAEKEGWPDRENQGYLGFSVSDEWKPLRREPGLLHVLVTVHVNEGPQKRLEKIEIRFAGGNYSPVFDSNTLRKLIPLKDGEIYNRDKYHAGVDALATAYAERGFVGLTTYETLALDDDNHTVALVIEITEGPKYRWGNIQVIGLDPKTETILRARLPKDRPVNPKLIRDFYQEYKSSLPLGAFPETVEWKHNPQRATVDLTFDFSTPPAEVVHD
jgi:outer membrane protein assembly factor BamA